MTRGTMKKLSYLILLLQILKGIHGEDHFEGFLDDLIKEWNLQSPTIVVHAGPPDICLTSQWVLCIFCKMDSTELAGHLANVERGSMQDSLIFGPGQSHGQLLAYIEHVDPFMFRLNTPVFMPLEYSDRIELRLDSNVVFYKEEKPGTYKLLDKFAVKGGTPIVIDLGKWDSSYGMRLHNYKNRWDRRTDLNGAKMVNNLGSYGNFFAKIIRDKSGKVVGSEGELQNIIFYIAEKLNAKIETTEFKLRGRWKMLENGSWTGGVGVLQRREADICRYSTY